MKIADDKVNVLGTGANSTAPPPIWRMTGRRFPISPSVKAKAAMMPTTMAISPPTCPVALKVTSSATSTK